MSAMTISTVAPLRSRTTWINTSLRNVVDVIRETEDNVLAVRVVNKSRSVEDEINSAGEICHVHRNRWCGKSNNTSCNKCSCGCSEADFNRSDGKGSNIGHNIAHFHSKQHIQYQFNIDIENYHVNSERDLIAGGSDGRKKLDSFPDSSLNVIRNSLASFGEGFCKRVSAEKYTSSSKSRSRRTDFGENMVKNASDNIYCFEENSRRSKTAKESAFYANTGKNLEENVNDGLKNDLAIHSGIHDDKEANFDANSPMSCSQKTANVAIQVFENYSSFTQRSSRPKVPELIVKSNRSRSTISCCCSGEREYGSEPEISSSCECCDINTADENIRSTSFSSDHRVNVNCMESSFGGCQTELKSTPDSSSITARIWSRIAYSLACCVSALTRTV